MRPLTSRSLKMRGGNIQVNVAPALTGKVTEYTKWVNDRPTKRHVWRQDVRGEDGYEKVS